MNKLLFLTILFFNNSCVYFKALVNGIEQPKVEISAVEISKASFSSINVNIDLALENPNDFDISLKNLAYKVSYKKLKLASGKKDEQIVLKAKSVSKLSLGLKINPSVLLFGAAEILDKGGAEVHLNAKALFQTPIKDVEYEYSKYHEIK